ncbi:MAG: tRNA 2-thiouridine(34) synthase MnmA [Sedimentisphaerales bacterium]|nr:tRNA 2-thiouridine(34) synthase MnmA [Sedimentisphaerales bacterium]
MTVEKQKVVVALSGGLDSSVTTALLLESGYDCQAAFMITSENNRHAQAGAEEVARHLGINLTVLDLRREFERILGYFFGEYARAHTPNPCVLCNRLIKFGRLLEFARQAGAQFLATGHYARIIPHDGRPGLCQAADLAKDQSYVLSMVNREALGHVLLPMGERTKNDARRIARELGLGTETKAESQEICFIPNDDYVALLEQHRPELVRVGPIVDGSGKILGTHRGVHRFTVGQRRGLRVAMGIPYYVTALDAAANTVVLGPKEEVMHHRLWAKGINWLVDEPLSDFRAKVRIRYNDRGKAATVFREGDGVRVEFDQPNMAITPGQLAVFYIDEDGMQRVAGAGWIDAVTD